MSEPMPAPRLVGLEPWLPWPLSASRWWTVPVRAERLAILRIGIAAVLLWDILQNYLPVFDVFYSDQGLLPPRVLIASGSTPIWAWSLLRGVNDPLTSTLALLAFLGSSALIFIVLVGQLKAPAEDPPRLSRGSLFVWIIAAVVWVMGVWSRLTPPAEGSEWLIWGAPALACGLSVAFNLLRLIQGNRNRRGSGVEFWTTLSLLVGLALVAIGIHKWSLVDTDPGGPSWLAAGFQRFDGNADVIFWTMMAWTIATVLLLAGLFARISAFVTWLLAVEIIHLNFAIGNGGDVVRVIALFYLMLAPCGAAWSVDAWWTRRRSASGGAVMVPPWALRLLFVQLTLIYFMNGLYKIVSPQWRDGTILYYVLNDPTLTRVAYAQFPVPLWLLQGSAWLVLGWELGFPLWVAWPLTRKLALAIGILFHIAIFLSMELGAFQLYMLALYLPLVLPRTPAEARPREEVWLGLEPAAN